MPASFSYGLVEPVGPAAPGHHPAGVLVDDHHLAVGGGGDDVLDIALVERVGAQELGDGMDLLGNLAEAVLGGQLFGLALLGREARVLVEI
jgi:hypothetical protein